MILLDATVAGRIVLREGGSPLGLTTVSVVSQGTQRLASEQGTFMLRDLPPGEVRLRFRRIGFAPKDTVRQGSSLVSAKRSNDNKKKRRSRDWQD